MTVPCDGPDCDVEMPSYDGEGINVDPKHADLPYFKLTYYDPDAEIHPEHPANMATGVYKTPRFCSRECVDAWLDAHPEADE